MSEFGPQFDRAQRQYESQLPPSDPREECEVCEGSGYVNAGDEQVTCPSCEGEGKVCHHEWHRLGEAKDGTQFAKCKKCGKTVEV